MSNSVQITPAPTEEEAAAIVAAIDAATPRVVFVEVPEQVRSAAWRFSGRWWAKPMAARRSRPFY